MNHILITRFWYPLLQCQPWTFAKPLGCCSLGAIWVADDLALFVAKHPLIQQPRVEYSGLTLYNTDQYRPKPLYNRCRTPHFFSKLCCAKKIGALPEAAYRVHHVHVDGMDAMHRNLWRAVCKDWRGRAADGLMWLSAWLRHRGFILIIIYGDFDGTYGNMGLFMTIYIQ